jgi:hypothetical protein
MDTFLAFAIPICTIFLGLSAFFDMWARYYGQRPIFQGHPLIDPSFFGKTWFKFVWFFVFTILSISLNYCQSQRSDKKAHNEISLRDSANQKHLDSSVNAVKDTTISTINTLLVKHNLIYDTGQRKIESLIKDSINLEIPSLDIISSRSGTINTLVDSLIFMIELKNTGNCPILINLRVFTGTWFSNNRLICKETKLGMNKYSLGPSTSVNFPVSFYYKFLPQKCFFLILGSYSNKKRTINNPIDEFLSWDIQSNTIGTPFDFKYKDSIEQSMKRTLSIPSL